MNCHRARQLISPYLDQQLSRREMDALQQHFLECSSCEAERYSLRQVKMLLRGMHEPRPRPDFAADLSLRLSEAEQPLWRVLFVSPLPSWPPRPQRGRRLATALALSCLTVFSFAAACFAPVPHPGTLASSAFLLPMGAASGQPAPENEASLTSLNAASRNDFLSLTGADSVRRERLFVSQYESPVQTELRLSPLPYEAASGEPGQAQLSAAFVGYRVR